MDSIRMCSWLHTFQIPILLASLGLPISSGFLSLPKTEDPQQGDNFDQIVGLFGNNYVQSFYDEWFTSVTQGPAELKYYCAFNRRLAKVRVLNGVANVYCVKDMIYLSQVVNTYLPKDGLSSERIEPAWDAGKKVLLRYGYSRICSKMCNDGYKPMIPTGNYFAPISKKTFSVGCRDVFSPCEASCSDDIYKVRNGEINCSRDTLVGSVCSVTCNEGYVEVGAKSVQCGRDQLWDNRNKLKCLPDDVGKVVNNLMRNEQLSYEGALDELRNKVEAFLGEKSGLSPSTRQEQNESSEEEDRLIEGIRTFLANMSANVDIVLKSINVDMCKIKPVRREDCGHPGISPDECRQRDCCWDSSVVGTYWCYYDANSVSSVNFSTKHAMKTPHSPSLVEPDNEVRPLHHNEPSVELVMPVNGVQPLHDSPFPFPSRPSEEQSTEGNKCGCVRQVARCLAMQYVQPLARVFCGRSIAVEKAPWHVMILYGDKMCGGTLISKKFVVTAGHCVVLNPGAPDTSSSNRVFLGASELSQIQQNRAPQKRNFKRVIRHPLFQLRGDSNVRNDIALIELSSEVAFTDGVQPLCLPSKARATVGKKCYITGFGETDPMSGKPAKYLQKVSLLVTDPKRCSSLYPSFRKQQNICAGPGRSGLADACRGDSGGPLACQRREGDGCSWYLAGITSFGREPCGKGTPGVYVDVSHYEDWIRQHTGLL